MHEVELLTEGIWVCMDCQALAVCQEQLAIRYEREEGEKIPPKVFGRAVAAVLADMVGCPICRVDTFSPEQVERMAGRPCPANADAIGIPSGSPELFYGQGVN
jgi:hypothetical protein